MSSESLTHLNRNEFFHEHHPYVQVLMGCEAGDISLYPQAEEISALEQNLSLLYSAESQNIILSHGAEDALWRLLAYYRHDHSSLILSTNSWNYYRKTALSLGYEIQWITSTYNNSQFATDLDELSVLLNKMSSPTVVLLASPNNPTAHELDLSRLHEISQAHTQCTFIIDGTYSGLENNVMTDAAQKCANVHYINSFSKFFGLPGVRIGFILHNGNLENLRNYLGVSSIAIKLANAVIENAQYYQAVWQAGKDLVRKLQMQNFRKIRILPPTTNFALVYTGLRWSEQIEKDVQLIAKKQSIVIKIENINDDLFARISLGTTKDIPSRIRRFLEELDDVVDSLPQPNNHSKDMRG